MSVDILRIVQQYIEDITQLPSDQGLSLDGILEKAVVGDRELRRLFALSPQDPRLHDLYLGLIDVFDIPASARRTRARPVTPASSDFSKYYVFPLPTDERRSHLMPSTVPTLEAFLECWEIFTHNVLSKMRPSTWQNVIVAGGSVLACLMAQRPQNTSAEDINRFYLGGAWGTSDIDLFLWGLSPEQVSFFPVILLQTRS